MNVYCPWDEIASALRSISCRYLRIITVKKAVFWVVKNSKDCSRVPSETVTAEEVEDFGEERRRCEVPVDRVTRVFNYGGRKLRGGEELLLHGRNGCRPRAAVAVQRGGVIGIHRAIENVLAAVSKEQGVGISWGRDNERLEKEDLSELDRIACVLI